MASHSICLLVAASTAGVWAAPAPVPPAANLWAYRVLQGDTLIGLHQRLLRPDADWRTVQKLNRVNNPRRLMPGSVLRIPVSLLREEPASAEVLHTHGEAWLERTGSPRQALAAAAVLVNGDWVVTGPQSSVSLRFADGSRSLLGPDSRLRVERLARLGASGAVETRLRLDAGSVDTRVTPAQPAPRFELRTPVVNLGVRGTEFRTRADVVRTVAEVLQGQVAVGAQTVPPGFGVAAGTAGVSPPRVLPAAPDLSALPERVERLPLLLSWGNATGAVRYRAQVYDAGQADRLLLDGLFEQPLASWGESPADGRYELRVRLADANGIEGLDTRRLFTIKARPEPPFLLRPRALERIADEAVTLAWSRNPQAASYKLQVSPNADFSGPLRELDGITATETQLTLPPGLQHWRLASVRSGGDTGPWGDALAFERIERPPPPPPTAAQPPRDSNDGIMLSWSASALAGATYQVQVARDAAFADLVLDEKTDRTEQLLASPQAGTYHVRVRTVGADGRAGSFGSAQQVEVPRSMWWLWLLPLLLLL